MPNLASKVKSRGFREFETLSTARQDFSNYELLVDWKIGPQGDSGIYLRGTPQVQIWDPRTDDHPKAALGNRNSHHPDPPKNSALRGPVVPAYPDS